MDQQLTASRPGPLPRRLIPAAAALAGLVMFVLILALFLLPCGFKHFYQEPAAGGLILFCLAVSLASLVFFALASARRPSIDSITFLHFAGLGALISLGFACSMLFNSCDYLGGFIWFEQEFLRQAGISLTLSLASFLPSIRTFFPDSRKLRLLIVAGSLLAAMALVFLFLLPSFLRTLGTSEESYKATEGSNGFGTLAQMSAAIPPYVDTVLGSGTKSGYNFILQLSTDGQAFTCRAFPVRYCLAPPVCRWDFCGFSSFWTDDTGVIRRAPVPAAADSRSPPID